MCDLGTFIPIVLIACDKIGFPTASLRYSLTLPRNSTPSPVFLDGMNNAAPLNWFGSHELSLLRVLQLSRHSVYGCIVSGTFHYPYGLLFTFRSHYYFAIGLIKYLDLPVNFRHFRMPKPRHSTLESLIVSSLYEYGAITLYGNLFQKCFFFGFEIV